MSAFAPPPVGQHTHVIDPPDRHAGFTRAHCRLCGYSLEYLLNVQRTCEVMSATAPSFWTAWRTPHTDELASG